MEDFANVQGETPRGHSRATSERENLLENGKVNHSQVHTGVGALEFLQASGRTSLNAQDTEQGPEIGDALKRD